jgi:hypothetical protein
MDPFAFQNAFHPFAHESLRCEKPFPEAIPFVQQVMASENVIKERKVESTDLDELEDAG